MDLVALQPYAPSPYDLDTSLSIRAEGGGTLPVQEEDKTGDSLQDFSQQLKDLKAALEKLFFTSAWINTRGIKEVIEQSAEAREDLPSVLDEEVDSIWRTFEEEEEEGGLAGLRASDADSGRSPLGVVPSGEADETLGEALGAARSLTVEAVMEELRESLYALNALPGESIAERSAESRQNEAGPLDAALEQGIESPVETDPAASTPDENVDRLAADPVSLDPHGILSMNPESQGLIGIPDEGDAEMKEEDAEEPLYPWMEEQMDEIAHTLLPILDPEGAGGLLVNLQA